MTIIFRPNFDRQMVKLGSIFGFLKEDALDDYYEILKTKDEDQLERAVSWLMEHHNVRKFPIPAEIIDAIQEIYKKDRGWDPEQEEEMCEKCYGEGMILGGWGSVAQYCECPAGGRRAEEHQHYFRNRTKRRRRPL